MHPATLSHVSVTFENWEEEIVVFKERSSIFLLHQDHLATSQSCCFDLVSCHRPVLYGHAAWNACRLRSSCRFSRVNKIDLFLWQLRLAVLCMLRPFLVELGRVPSPQSNTPGGGYQAIREDILHEIPGHPCAKTVERNAEGPTNIFSTNPVPFNP